VRALSWILVATSISGCIIEPPDMVKDGGTQSDASIPMPRDAGGISLPDGGFNWDWDGGWIGGGDGNGGGIGNGGGGGSGGGGGGGGGSGGGGGGGGGKGDGGVPGVDGGSAPDAGAEASTFPGSGRNGDPGTGVLWLVRIDRGTANLAASYAPLVRNLNDQLASQGFDVRTTSVGSLYTSQLLWSSSGKDVNTSSVQAALESAAKTASTPPSTCSTAVLASMGRELNMTPVPTGGFPFSTPRSALLVVILDHGTRPMGASASACGAEGQLPADWFGGERARTRWLNTASGGWNLPRSQTRFLFISTPENETYAQMRERCAAMSAFPRTGLDALSPSSVPFYESFNEGLGRYQTGLGSRKDLCQAVAQDWTGYSLDFARRWSQLLRLPEAQR
jgi:hypothetical protein